MSRALLAALLPTVLLLGPARGTRAAEAAPAEPPAQDAEPPEQDTWLDVSHAFLERTLLAPALAFDRFFSDERELEPERSRSFLRWRNEIRVTEDVSSPSFTTGVRANLRFPGLNRRLRRLRVVIAGETRDTFSALFPRDEAEPGTPVQSQEDASIGRGDAGLRLDLVESVLAHVDLGGGVLMEMPPGAYTRLRVRWAIPIPKVLLTRWAVSGSWRTDTRFGTSGALDLERPFGRAFLARLSGGATLTEESAGFEWAAEAALFAAIGPRSGAALGGGPSGATEHPVDVDRWRVFARVRSDVYRRWIFVEAEPEVAWPWTPERGRHATFAIAFRLEVQFHGSEPAQEEPERGPEQAREGDRGG